MKNELLWKDLQGYEGLYQISNTGKIKSLVRQINTPTGFGFLKERIKVPANHKQGYLKVDLVKDSKPKRFFIHRLVANSFIPNPENKPEVNHKNGIKTDNRVENLEWCTPSENSYHKYATGLFVQYSGLQNKRSKPVMRINRDGRLVSIYPSAGMASLKEKVSSGVISQHCRGIIKAHTQVINGNFYQGMNMFHLKRF